MPKRNRATVVNVRTDTCDVYVGRGARGYRKSKYGNPFRIGRDGDRETVIRKYKGWLIANQNLMREARKELTGKRLGCHCAPLDCHARVLAGLVNGEWWN